MGRWVVKCSTIVNYEIAVDHVNSEEEAINKAKAGEYRFEDIWELGQEAGEWVYDSAEEVDTDEDEIEEL